MTCASYDYVSELEDRINELERKMEKVLENTGASKTYVLEHPYTEEKYVFKDMEKAQEFLNSKKGKRKFPSYTNIKEEFTYDKGV